MHKADTCICVWAPAGSRGGGATPLNTCNTTRGTSSSTASASSIVSSFVSTGGAAAEASSASGAVSRSAVTVLGANAPVGAEESLAGPVAGMPWVNLNGASFGPRSPYGTANGQGNWGTGNGQGNGGSGNGNGNIGSGALPHICVR